MELWISAVVAGFLAQLVDVATGMGFGAMASSLMLATGLPPLLVVTTVNLVKVGNGLLAGLSHWGFGNVRRDWVIPLAASGVLGALTGAACIGRWSGAVRLWSPLVLLILGGLLLCRFLLAVEGKLTVEIFSPRKSKEDVPRISCDGEQTDSSGLLIAIGFLAGFFNAMSGAYGPLVTTLLVLIRRAPARYVIGTVSLAELFVAGASAIGLLQALDSRAFSLGLPAALMAGGALASPLGAYLCRYLPGRILEGFVGLAVVSLNLWNVLHLPR